VLWLMVVGAVATQVAKGDGEGAARLMMERSREQHHVDPEGFERDMGALVNTVTASTFTCAQVPLRPTHAGGWHTSGFAYLLPY
jgi:hypothetical protein